jgi:ABC-type Fe3+-siderophore transport system permease subunit
VCPIPPGRGGGRFCGGGPRPAALIGGGFLLAIDTLARTMAPIEIPLGILTAFVGTPFFIWLLASVSKEWSAP